MANEWQQIYKDIYLVERIHRSGRGAKLFVKLNLMSKYKFSKKKGKFEASSFTWPQAFAEVVEWAEGAAEAAADDRAQDADDLWGKKILNFVLLQNLFDILYSTDLNSPWCILGSIFINSKCN